jgi:hypothetical protein
MRIPTYYDLKKKKIVFLDDFEDGVISPKWIMSGQPDSWTESNGRLVGYLPISGNYAITGARFKEDLKYKKIQLEGHMICWCQSGFAIGTTTIEVTDQSNVATLFSFGCHNGDYYQEHRRFVLKINITEKKIEGYIVTDSYPNVNVITPINVDISNWKSCNILFGLTKARDAWVALTLDYIAEVKEFF